MTAVVGDRRLTPARPDLAAAYLEGRVTADRFVAGERRSIIAGVADIRRQPRPDAPLETQALFGEAVQLYDDDEGWGWVQLERDSYVGYVAMHAIGKAPADPTHRVIANRTFVYPAPDLKTPVMAALPLGAKLIVESDTGRFSRMADGGFVFTDHIAPADTTVADFVTIAEHFAYTPYLWGGKTSKGIDCSGLVQVSLGLQGIAAPRDTDLQEQSVGTALSFDTQHAALLRGDLIFWHGHVGIMRDAETLIHANAHHMMVAMEPLSIATNRIRANSQAEITSIRRIANR